MNISAALLALTVAVSAADDTSMTTRSLMFTVYETCSICPEGSTLSDPDATVMGMHIPCSTVEIAGKISLFRADYCIIARQACDCESTESDTDNTTESSRSDTDNTTESSRSDADNTTLQQDSPWYDLVGLDGQEAKDIIQAQFPELTVYVLPWGSIVTADYRTDRVRIYVDENNIVKVEPTIG